MLCAWRCQQALLFGSESQPGLPQAGRRAPSAQRSSVRASPSQRSMRASMASISGMLLILSIIVAMCKSSLGSSSSSQDSVPFAGPEVISRDSTREFFVAAVFFVRARNHKQSPWRSGHLAKPTTSVQLLTIAHWKVHFS